MRLPAFLAILSTIVPVAAQSWTSTGTLEAARSLHTATPLANGTVLVVGGLGGRAPVAEIYTPSTGRWSAAASPATTRVNHAAARLHDGRVLIAGGSDHSFATILRRAEIYDPDTGVWSSAGDTVALRATPKGVLLTSGKLLLIGGAGAPGAEVYDPAANTWTATGPMSSIRILHAAVALADGRAMSIGGSTGSVTQSLVEIYDPAANAWTPGAPLNTARQIHAAVVLADGRVLVSGGSPNNSGPFLATCELFDPATGRWTVTGSMSSARVNHRLVPLPGGKVVAVAGASTDTEFPRLAEAFDPAAGTWSPAAEQESGFGSNPSATLLPNGKVLLAGGRREGADGAASALLDSGAPSATSVSAASFAFGAAPGSLGAAFGSGLALETVSAATVPPPAELAGVTVRVTDGAGVARSAALLFASPGQINYLVPPGAAPGSGTVTVLRGASVVAGGALEIVRTAPGIFTADGSGAGLPAAQIFRRTAAGVESVERVDAPIDLGAESDQVFLILYGTGIRLRRALDSVRVAAGGVECEVTYAGETPGFFGLDQVNVRLPRSLAGRGGVDVALTVDGRAANRVRITVR